MSLLTKVVLDMSRRARNNCELPSRGIGAEELVSLVVVGVDLLGLELDVVMLQADALVKGPSVIVLLVRVFKGLK